MKTAILLSVLLVVASIELKASESSNNMTSFPRYSVSDIWSFDKNTNSEKLFVVSGILIEGDRWFYLFDGFDDVIKYDFSRAIVVDLHGEHKESIEGFEGCYVSFLGSYRKVGDSFSIDYEGEIYRSGYFAFPEITRSLRVVNGKESTCLMDFFRTKQ